MLELQKELEKVHEKRWANLLLAQAAVSEPATAITVLPGEASRVRLPLLTIPIPSPVSVNADRAEQQAPQQKGTL